MDTITHVNIDFALYADGRLLWTINRADAGGATQLCEEFGPFQEPSGIEHGLNALLYLMYQEFDLPAPSSIQLRIPTNPGQLTLHRTIKDALEADASA